jgi:phosphoribosylglycinamide formyltransferase 2
MNDAEELTALIEKENPRYVVAEAGVIAADALIAVAERGNIEVFPTPRSTRLSIDREGCAGWPPTSSAAHRAVLVRRVGGGADRGGRARGFPAGRQADAAAPGDGQSVLVRVDDVEPAWHRAWPRAASRTTG